MRRRDENEPTEAEIRDVQLTRILAWFKTQLPPHDVGAWSFEIHPQLWMLRGGEGYSMRSQKPTAHAYLFARARCLRCHHPFSVGFESDVYAGRAGVYISDQTNAEDLAKAEATARERIEKDAERAGECWGHVPHVPERPNYVIVG